MVDRYGRKIPLYIGAIFMLAGALFGGLSHTRAELCGARVLLGIGTAFARELLRNPPVASRQRGFSSYMASSLSRALRRDAC